MVVTIGAEVSEARAALASCSASSAGGMLLKREVETFWAETEEASVASESLSGNARCRPFGSMCLKNTFVVV
jgi:hypothetical protein